jgi:hypothetical protein
MARAMELKSPRNRLDWLALAELLDSHALQWGRQFWSLRMGISGNIAT